MSEQRPQKRRKLTHKEETDAEIELRIPVSDLIGSMFPQYKTNRDVEEIVFNYLDVNALLSCASVCKFWNTHVFALLERIDFIGLDCKLWRTIAKGLNYDQIRHAKVSEDFPDEIVMHWDLLSKCTNLVSLKTPSNPTQPELQPATIAKMTQLTQLLYIGTTQDNLQEYTMLRNLTKLEVLFFMMYICNENVNEVPDMWSMLTRLTKLTYLYLQIRNNTEEIEMMPFNLAPLRQITQLTELHISQYGDMEYQDIDSFSALQNLKTIGIRDVQETPKLGGVFSTLASLTSLSSLRTMFQIDELVPLELLQRLTHLHCFYEPSKVATEPLTNLRSLSLGNLSTKLTTYSLSTEFCRNFDFASNWTNITELHLQLDREQTESTLKLTALRNLKYLEIGRQSEGPYLTKLLSLMQHVPLIALDSYVEKLPKNVMSSSNHFDYSTA